MIEITGKYNIADVYAESIEPGAVGLIQALCNSPASEGATICVMPDVHPGKGCCVGTTMAIKDRVPPGLVGVDIGCGMLCVKLDCKRLELEKLDKVVHEKLPANRSGRNSIHRFADNIDLGELRCARHIRREKALSALGTLGGGNHFVEVDRDSEGAFWLVIHSGSRILGVDVEKFYHDLAAETCPKEVPYELAYLTGSAKDDYIHDVLVACRFADQSRLAMADEICKAMKAGGADRFTTLHNYIDYDEEIVRKGAVSAQMGERLIIPMNMRDGCLLCVGKGNEDWNCSAPHGAGRLLSRSDAKASLTLSQFKREMNHVYSTSVSRATIDESPMAYKPMASILSQIEPTVEVADRLIPVYNYKAGVE